MASQLKDENEIKIFILYLLDKIGYPLDYPSIGSIMMQDGIVNFFDFAQCFFALVDAGHIREITVERDANGKILASDGAHGTAKAGIGGDTGAGGGAPEDGETTTTVLYEVTDTGKQVAQVLAGNLMISVREKSYRSALRHLSFAKKGAYVDHTFEPDGDGFLVTCTIKDKNGVIMNLTVRADSEYQMKRMRNNFSDRPEVVFRGIVALLSGDVNYLFEQ